ncbi:MAG: hypothetical protein Q8M26_04410 [Pseudolabrys sp.]|nr:hypothetical protein [Pseudolabrys sp.]
MTIPPKNGYEAARRAALLLRGEVIDLFAQVECAIGDVLVRAAIMPEYKALKLALPSLMGQKLERLRTLSTKAGPLQTQANGVASLVEKLASFERYRHFMAHGVVEVALKESGEAIYIFRMVCAPSKEYPDSTLVLTRPEAQSRTARLAGTVKSLVAALDPIDAKAGKKGLSSPRP